MQHSEPRPSASVCACRRRGETAMAAVCLGRASTPQTHGRLASEDCVRTAMACAAIHRLRAGRDQCERDAQRPRPARRHQRSPVSSTALGAPHQRSPDRCLLRISGSGTPRLNRSSLCPPPARLRRRKTSRWLELRHPPMMCPASTHRQDVDDGSAGRQIRTGEALLHERRRMKMPRSSIGASWEQHRS